MPEIPKILPAAIKNPAQPENPPLNRLLATHLMQFLMQVGN